MKSYTIIQRRNPVFEQCPACFSSDTIYRSHSRNWREKLIKKVTFLKIYKCTKCGWRGYRSTATMTVRSFQTLLIYIGIAIIIALIVRILLSRVAT